MPDPSGQQEESAVFTDEQIAKESNDSLSEEGEQSGIGGAAAAANARLEQSPRVLSNARGKQVTVPEPDAWQSYEYEVLDKQDISTGLRKRVRVTIASANALTPEARLKTAMTAAIKVHREEGLPDFVTVFLQQAQAENPYTIAIVDFAPDGCGVSGEDCTGEMWTKLAASSVVPTQQQVAITNAWFQHEEDFFETVGVGIEDEAYVLAMEKLKHSYGALMKFKNESDFRQYGFAPRGPYGPWLAEVRQNEERYPDMFLYADVSFGDLMNLGTAYVSSEGQETEFTRWINERFSVAVSSEKGESSFQDFNKEGLLAFLGAKFAVRPEVIEDAQNQYYAAVAGLQDYELPEQLKDFGALSQEEQEAACRWDLQCWGDKHSLGATFACEPHVEDLSLYAHEWTDGWLGAKFTHFRWKDMNSGVVTYMGDEIRYQNAFGAWVSHRYWCDYDTIREAALSVRAEPGRM